MAKKGLIYSIYDELIITNSSITLFNKCYDDFIVYKIIGGGVKEQNNWWGENNPDLNKLIKYEYENYIDKINKNNNLRNNVASSEGCSSAIIQIDEKNSAISFRRDSDDSINVNIIYQKNGILQFKNDPDYFWHVIVNNNGWIVGNGGVDTPYSAEQLEAYAKIMIEKNDIIDELLDNAYKIKSMLRLGHYFIKAPDGTYGLLIHIIDEKKVKLEKGKLKSGEYIISPNNYKFYQKGNISDLNINDKNNTYISRYLTAIDEYSNARTNDFTYNYITTDNLKYVDIFTANDDGSMAKKDNNSYLYNDICFNNKYILGEKVPIIMDGMYLDRYLIESHKEGNKNTYLKINLSIIFLFLGLLLINWKKIFNQ